MPPARAVFQAECEAMLAADSVSLGALLAPAFTLTHATIWGMRGTWRLLLKNCFREVDGEWLITRTVASTW